METTKVACPVCSGKGGFRKQKKDFLDSNWTDCIYCEGYGFVDEMVEEEDARDFLKYSNYRSKLHSELSSIGEVTAISCDTIGKDLLVQIVPKKKNVWVPFLKTLTKFSAYNNSLTAVPKQVFFYNKAKESHHYFIEVDITMESLSCLDGLIELIKVYNEQGA
jgi:hypothetical protein